jgi:hypothetical protein
MILDLCLAGRDEPIYSSYRDSQTQKHSRSAVGLNQFEFVRDRGCADGGAGMTALKYRSLHA